MAQRPNFPEPEKRSVPETAKPYTYISESAVRKIQRLLDERNNPPPAKKKEQITNKLAHPHGLLPIHLSKEPITVEYPSASQPEPPIRKRRIENPADKRLPSTSSFDSSRPRKKHKFIDDSAIESDGEGGDVPSTTTTPANTPPSTPVRETEPLSQSNTPSISLPPTPTQVYRIPRLPDPDKWCELCKLKTTSKKQLDKHLKGRKHKKTYLISKSKNPDNYCYICQHKFDNYSNFAKHDCSNFEK